MEKRAQFSYRIAKYGTKRKKKDFSELREIPYEYFTCVCVRETESESCEFV
jgi:hypothetical protein